MALESSYLNLIRGNRISSYMGLEAQSLKDPGQFNKGNEYTFIEIPIHQILNGEEAVETAKRNQYVQISPDCTLQVRSGYRILVEPNPKLAEYGHMQAGYYIHPQDGRVIPIFWMLMRKDMDLSDVQYAVRLYLRA